VDELGRDGEEIGRASATFLVGNPDEATQVVEATGTAEQLGATETSEIENGQATAEVVDAANTAQAAALQTVEANGTENAVQAEVSGTQTAEFGATVTFAGSLQGHTQTLPLAVYLGLESGDLDLAAERARLAKEMAKADADIARVDQKLGNPNFVARAPEDVVEEEKEKREEAQARKAKIAEAMERLKGAA